MKNQNQNDLYEIQRERTEDALFQLSMMDCPFGRAGAEFMARSLRTLRALDGDREDHGQSRTRLYAIGASDRQKLVKVKVTIKNFSRYLRRSFFRKPVKIA